MPRKWGIFLVHVWNRLLSVMLLLDVRSITDIDNQDEFAMSRGALGGVYAL